MKAKKSFTLIELLMGIVLLGIIMLALSNVSTTFSIKMMSSTREATLYHNTNFAMEHMLRRISQANSVNVAYGGNSMLVYKVGAWPLHGEKYYVQNNQLLYQGDTANPAKFEVILNGLSQITFGGTESLGNNAYRAVRITIKAKDPLNRISTESYLHSLAYCRIASQGKMVRLVDNSGNVKLYYDKIQEAIDGARNGDTVQVAYNNNTPYNEKIVIIDKVVSLKGGYDNNWVRHTDPVTGAILPGYETVIKGRSTIGDSAIAIATVNQRNQSWLVDGFTIEGISSSNSAISVIANMDTTLTISHNTISGSNSAGMALSGMWTNAVFNISDNSINYSKSGIHLDGIEGKCSITNNITTATAFTGTNNYMIDISRSIGGEFTISNNTSLEPSGYGIHYVIGQNQYLGTCSFDIENNTITNKQVDAIYIDQDLVSNPPSWISPQSITIQSNTLANNKQDIWLKNYGQMNISSNKITDTTNYNDSVLLNRLFVRKIGYSPPDVTIDNNLVIGPAINSYAGFNLQNTAIWPATAVDMTANTTITNNTIQHFRQGISFAAQSAFTAGSGKKTIIQNNLITYNNFGLSLANQIALTIQNNILSNNSNQGASISGVESLALQNNTVANNYTGVSISTNNARVTNNLIAGNTYAGIDLWASPNLVRNNLILGNKDGIRVDSMPFGSTLTLINNAMVNNTGAGVNKIVSNSVSVLNSIFWQNNPDFLGSVAFSYSDTAVLQPGLGNIGNQDPLFTDPLNGVYILQDSSPCKDKGNPAVLYYDPPGNASSLPTDPALPPAKGTVINDMGVYGGPYAGQIGASGSIGSSLN